MYSDWSAAARAEIADRMSMLSENASLAERRKALRKDATMFHGGTSWGRKVWSKECRKYLEQRGLPPRSPADVSPQSKLYGKIKSGDIIFPFRSEASPDAR